MRTALLIMMGLLLSACANLPDVYQPPPLPLISAITDIAEEDRTYFVDQGLQINPCTRYSASERTCASGRDLAFNNLADANGMAAAGDTIYLRSGTYAEQVAPQSSGTQSAPIKYRSFPRESVQIVTPDAPALWLIDVQHVEISGLVVRDSQGWARLENAHHNTISGNDFREALARGTTGGFKLVRSHFNTVRDNTFYRGNDSIVIQHSDANRIVDNHLEFARHALFSIRCGNHNIVRNNFLHNERQKIGEVYDCEAISDAPYLLDATKRNLIEGNHFAFSRGSDRVTRYNGIQLSGQMGLIRNNLFKNNEGGAIHLAVYNDEAVNNYANRLVGNWFFDNRCYAISASAAAGVRVGDNRAIGNLLSGNVDCQGYARSTMRAPHLALIDNEESPSPVQGLPKVWLSRTMSAGRGDAIPLDDVLPFYDGFDLVGERGDSIEIESTGEDATITDIDYVAGRLIIDRELTWMGGDGVRVLETMARQPFTVIPSERVVKDP